MPFETKLENCGELYPSWDGICLTDAQVRALRIRRNVDGVAPTNEQILAQLILQNLNSQDDPTPRLVLS